MKRTDLTTALWTAFWLFVLTTGDPDIIDLVQTWLGNQL